MPSLTGGEKEKHDLLVGTTQLGHHLAAAFKPSTSGVFFYKTMRAALPSQLSGGAESSMEPSHPVVLMRGHGFTTCADSLEAVVFQSIYTKEAAKAETQALLTNAAYFTELSFTDSMSMEGTVNVGEKGSGKIKSGKVKGGKMRRESEEVKYLSEREANDAWEVIRATIMRPWGLWCREVEVNPLYRNEVKREGEEKVSIVEQE
jgi:ribulose-5-phosphate 4-epimerase/fuculose-1-phosphate aldolase